MLQTVKNMHHLRWLLLAVLVAIGLYFLIYQDFLTLQKAFLFDDIGSDTLYSYWPQYIQMIREFPSSMLGGWSFALGIGAPWPTVVANDPFAYLLVAFGAEALPGSLIWVQLIKLVIVVIAGFYFFLLRGLDPHWAAAFSLMFGFNAYFFIWGQHYFFASAFAIFIVSLFAIEYWIKRENPVLLVVALGLLSSGVIFFVPGVIFLFFYLIVRGFDLQWSVKNIVLKILLLGICTLGGMLLNAYFLYPQVIALLESSRIEGLGQGLLDRLLAWKIFPVSDYFLIVLRAYSPLLPGVGSQYTHAYGHNYYEAPHLFSSAIVILLVTYVALFTRRQHLPNMILLIFLLLLLLLPAGSYLMTLGVRTDYRWTFIVIVQAIIVASVALGSFEQTQPERNWMVATTFILTACLVIVVLASIIYLELHPHPKNPNASIERKVAILIPYTLYAIGFMVAYNLLLLIGSGKKIKISSTVLAALVIAMLAFEFHAIYSTEIARRKNLMLNERGQVTEYLTDGTEEALDWIRKQEEGKFFRVAKDYNTLLYGDEWLQGYNGFRQYSSLISVYYRKLLSSFGIPYKGPTRVDWNSAHHSAMASFLGAKYFLARQPCVNQPPYIIEQSVGDICILSNPQVFPFAFASSTLFNENTLGSVRPAMRESMLFSGLFVSGKLGHQLEIQSKFSEQTSVVDESTQTIQGEVFYFGTVPDITTKKVVWEISMERDGVAVFQMPYNNYWKAFRNSERVLPIVVNFGLYGIPLAKGHNKVVLEYTVPGRPLTAFISLSVLTFLILFSKYSRAKFFGGWHK